MESNYKYFTSNSLQFISILNLFRYFFLFLFSLLLLLLLLFLCVLRFFALKYVQTFSFGNHISIHLITLVAVANWHGMKKHWMGEGYCVTRWKGMPQGDEVWIKLLFGWIFRVFHKIAVKMLFFFSPTSRHVRQHGCSRLPNESHAIVLHARVLFKSLFTHTHNVNHKLSWH